MSIADLIKYCETRIEFLNSAKVSYMQLADYDMINKIDLEILATQDTLTKLNNTIQ